MPWAHHRLIERLVSSECLRDRNSAYRSVRSEFVGGNVGDHVPSTDAGIDEHHVELSRCQTRPQRDNLIRISNVDGRDFESTLSGSRYIVQF